MSAIIPWRHNKPARSADRRSDPLAELHRQMNDLFDDFFDSSPLGMFSGPAHIEPSSRVPRVDISETDQALSLVAELPGVEEKDIQVSLDNGLLTIEAESEQEHEEDNKHYHLTERHYGKFQRSFRMPANTIDEEAISATFKNGVLSVSLPKLTEASPTRKTITVKSE